MKNRIIAIAVIALGISASASAQSTATASTTATLITPISIVKNTDLNFGTVAASATAGTVALDYANGRTAGGGVSLPAGSTAQTTAVFTVTGEGTNSFSIAVPTSAITLSSGTASLTVDNFAADLGASSTLTAGSATIKVKATLNVPANAVAGTYTNASGLFVTVNYN